MKRQPKQPADSVAPAALKASPQSGAPAALEAIAAHEVRCRGEMDSAYADWIEKKEKRVEGDDVSERAANKAHRDYMDSLEVWHDASKKLLDYDTKISPSRREGEKASVEDVKEWFAQLMLTIDLGIEGVIKSNSQAAALSQSPESFYTLAAEQYRAAKASALASAVESGVLPKWILA